MPEPKDIVVGPELLRCWALELKRIALQLEFSNSKEDGIHMMTVASLLMEEKAEILEDDDLPKGFKQ